MVICKHDRLTHVSLMKEDYLTWGQNNDRYLTLRVLYKQIVGIN